MQPILERKKNRNGQEFLTGLIEDSYNIKYGKGNKNKQGTKKPGPGKTIYIPKFDFIRPKNDFFPGACVIHFSAEIRSMVVLSSSRVILDFTI